LAKEEVYTIKVLNWDKHNGKKKRGHQYIFLSTRFFDDPKISAATLQDRLLYIAILLRCGDETSATVVATSKQLRSQVGANTLRTRSALNRLEQLRLLTVEKIEPFRCITRQGNALLNKASHKKDIAPNGAQAQLPLDPAPAAPHPLLLVWNQNRGKLPAAVSCTGKRLERAKARWKEQEPEVWQATVKRLAESAFCTGNNDRGWRADFDFLLKPETWAKVNDGKYDNHKGAASTRATRTYDALDRLEQDLIERGPR
jgi:hypothetical protein